jgi:hypothetical protein
MKTRFVTLFILFLLASALPGVFLSTHAQTPSAQPILSWQAQNFFPSDFQGKPLPTENTRVLVSLTALRGGAFVDLSRTSIRWYVDSTAVSRGVGLTDISFVVTKHQGDFHYVRASIEWPNADPQDTAVQVPVTERFIVLGGVPTNTLLSPSIDITLEAFPYFFNIASLGDLNFYWTVNGKRVSGVLGNAVTLTVPTADPVNGGSLSASVVAQGKRDLLEYGKGSFRTGISF